MLHAQIIDPAQLRLRFLLTMLLAMAAAAGATFAYLLAKTPGLAHGELWGWGSTAGQILALLLAMDANRQWKAVRSLPRSARHKEQSSNAIAAFLKSAADRAHDARASSESKRAASINDVPNMEAERAKLRAQGFNDYEISKILIARATGGGSHGGGGSLGPGVLGGHLANFGTVLGLARNALPNFLHELETVLFGGVSPRERFRAFGSVLVKSAFIAVLGYFASIEINMVLIEMRKRHAEECKVRQETMIGYSTIYELEHGSERMKKLDEECRSL